MNKNRDNSNETKDFDILEDIEAETEDHSKDLEVEDEEICVAESPNADMGSTVLEAGEVEHDEIGEENPEQDPIDHIAALEGQVTELNDKLLRALAETENVRRRSQRDREDAAKFSIKNFAEGMLGVADNLGRALASIDPEDREKDSGLENILVGLEMVQKDLMNTFERFGVFPITALGAKFDPMLHEAMFEVEDKKAPSGTVAQVLEPGYQLNGRTLRAAKVGITKGGPKETTDSVAEVPEEESAITSTQASRDGQAAYENQTDPASESGKNLDQEL